MRRHIYAGSLQVKAGDWVASQLFLRKLIDTCVPGRSSGLLFTQPPSRKISSGFWLHTSLRQGGGLKTKVFNFCHQVTKTQRFDFQCIFFEPLWLKTLLRQPLLEGFEFTATGIAPVFHRTSLLIPAMRHGNRLQVQMWGN